MFERAETSARSAGLNLWANALHALRKWAWPTKSSRPVAGALRGVAHFHRTHAGQHASRRVGASVRRTHHRNPPGRCCTAVC